MRKAIRLLAVVAIIATALLGLGTDTAYAHNQDNNSLWGCAATRPSSDYSIDHSWWDGLFPGVVVGRCMAHSASNGNQTCWRLTWYVDQGTFQGTGYDYQPPCWFSEP